MSCELRLGRYQDVLADVEVCDSLIADGPYSARTHEGRRTGSEIRQSSITYEPMTEELAAELARLWAPRVRFWVVLFCDHVARAWHEAAWEAAGFYVCGPVRWVKPDAPPRMCGDGPTVSSEDILVAAPAAMVEQTTGDILVARTAVAHKRHPGSRRGHYIVPGTNHGNTAAYRGKSYPGAKPLALMRQLVRDYSLPGDLIVDCYAGTGTTLRAAVTEGRSAIGSERDVDTFALAQDRLRGLGPSLGPQKNLFGEAV